MVKDGSLLRDKNLQLIFGVTLIAVMGVASITPAFPEVIRFFQISPRQVGWLIVAFTLPGIALTPVAGILADRLGRKPVLIPSLFIFGLGGLACFFVHDFYWLLLLRFVQGIGASSLASINVTLIGDLYSGPTRVKAMGYNASVLSVGTASYPALGGILASLGWQYVFLLPLLAIPLALVLLKELDNPEPKRNSSLKNYFKNVWRTINRQVVWALFGLNVLLFIILYGSYLTYFPLLVELRFHQGALMIGIAMSFMSAVTALTSFNMAAINRWFKPWFQLLIATLFYLGSLLLLSDSFDWLTTLFGLILFGFGHGILIPVLQNLLVGLASMEERAAFMSLNSMVLRVGQTVGPLVIGLFYQLGGISMAFRGGAFTALLMFVVVLLFLKPSEINGGPK